MRVVNTLAGRLQHITCFLADARVAIVSSMFPPCVAGQMVYTVRQRCGRQLAIEAPTEADVVSTVPESATPAALGYAEQVSRGTY